MLYERIEVRHGSRGGLTQAAHVMIAMPSLPSSALMIGGWRPRRWPCMPPGPTSACRRKTGAAASNRADFLTLDVPVSDVEVLSIGGQLGNLEK